MDKIRPIAEIFPLRIGFASSLCQRCGWLERPCGHTRGRQSLRFHCFWDNYFAKYHATVTALPQVVETTCAWFGDYDRIRKSIPIWSALFVPPTRRYQMDLSIGIFRRCCWHMALQVIPRRRRMILRGLPVRWENQGFIQGNVCCEFYPYDVKTSDVCCTLFFGGTNCKANEHFQ